MALFWNKQIEPTKVVYTRSKGQKRTGYLMMISGFVLFIGIPTLIKNSSFFAELSKQSNGLAVFFLVLMGLGVILIIFTAITMSSVNFKLAAAKSKNKKFQISSNNDGDMVTIEN